MLRDRGFCELLPGWFLKARESRICSGVSNNDDDLTGGKSKKGEDIPIRVMHYHGKFTNLAGYEAPSHLRKKRMLRTNQ